MFFSFFRHHGVSHITGLMRTFSDWTILHSLVFGPNYYSLRCACLKADVHSKANKAIFMRSNPVTKDICSKHTVSVLTREAAGQRLQLKHLQGLTDTHLNSSQNTGVSYGFISWCDPFSPLKVHCSKCSFVFWNAYIIQYNVHRAFANIPSTVTLPNWYCDQISKSSNWGSVKVTSLDKNRVKHNWKCEYKTAGSHWANTDVIECVHLIQWTKSVDSMDFHCITHALVLVTNTSAIAALLTMHRHVL